MDLWINAVIILPRQSGVLSARLVHQIPRLRRGEHRTELQKTCALELTKQTFLTKRALLQGCFPS